MQNSFHHSVLFLLSFYALSMSSMYGVLYIICFISYPSKQHCRGVNTTIWFKQRYYHQVKRLCNYTRHQSTRIRANTSFWLGVMSYFFLYFMAHTDLHATVVQIKNEACHVYKNTQAKQRPKQNKTPCADTLP